MKSRSKKTQGKTQTKKSKQSKSNKRGLLSKKESAWGKENKKAFEFSKNYKIFLEAKTERETVREILKIIKKKGFKDISKIRSLKKGDKIYHTYKDKTIIFGILGKSDADIRVVGSHLDSPRLDLKPNPLFEDSGLACLRTHYYGGIKKYQWVNQPLVMKGTVVTSKGMINLDFDDCVLVIPDLLPHLAKDQMEKDARKVITGEDLVLIAGNIPKGKKHPLKTAIMSELNAKYGLVEDDFISAEIEVVPAIKPMDAGIDKSMILAYGHDDRLSVYTSMMALLDSSTTKTAFVACFDKEETGSDGNTGAKSRLVENFFYDLERLGGIRNARDALCKMDVISADVEDCVNPMFKEVHELSNANIMGNGVCFRKYGGAGGKYYTNDSNAEYVGKIRRLFDKANVRWQSGETGKVDQGGGGTIAAFFSRYGCDVIDVGAPVLATHAPYELASKIDIYQSYKAYKAFLK